MPYEIQFLLNSFIFFGLALQKLCWFSLSSFTVSQVYSDWFFSCVLGYFILANLTAWHNCAESLGAKAFYDMFIDLPMY